MPYQHKYFETVESYKNKTRNQQKPMSAGANLKMKKNLVQIQGFFIESLENQLKTTGIFPEQMPKLVTVRFNSNKIKIENIYIENDNIVNFFQKIQEKSIEIGEPIREFNPESVVLITVPFFNREEAELLLTMYHKQEESKLLIETILSKIDCSKEYRLKIGEKFEMNNIDHGDMIIIFGEIKFRNDFPPECITFEFKANVPWNYFSCSECKIKCYLSFYFLNLFFSLP